MVEPQYYITKLNLLWIFYSTKQLSDHSTVNSILTYFYTCIILRTVIIVKSFFFIFFLIIFSILVLCYTIFWQHLEKNGKNYFIRLRSYYFLLLFLFFIVPIFLVTVFFFIFYQMRFKRFSFNLVSKNSYLLLI